MRRKKVKMEKIEWLKEGQWLKDVGEIRIFGKRQGLVWGSILADLRNDVFKIIGPAVDRLLYDAGKNHIRKLIESFIERSVAIKALRRFRWVKIKIAKRAGDLFAWYGWGVGKVEKVNPEGESIVTLKNSIIASYYTEKQTKPVCSYIAGIIAGAASTIFNKDYECEEVECLAMGHRHCKFIVRPVK
jgi:predicted hydrocarbon binding protein